MKDIPSQIITPEFLADVGKFVTRRAKENVPVYRGDLRESIDYEVLPDEFAVVIGTDYDVGAYMEWGTPPGHFPPVDKIQQWVLDKGIGDPEKSDKTAFLIGRKISREGIKVGTPEIPMTFESGLRPWLRPAVLQSRQWIGRILQEHLR